MMWQILESAVIVVGAFFLGTAALAYRAKKRVRSDFNYAMQVLAAGTVKRARAEQKISLDYSVMKRVRPGQWRRDSEKAGAGAMPLIFGDFEAFPCSWAYKRIADGPEDNIVFKFQVFSDQQLRDSLGFDRAKPR